MERITETLQRVGREAAGEGQRGLNSNRHGGTGLAVRGPGRESLIKGSYWGVG